MTEDELLAGLTDALTIAGWTWTHIRRSDGVTQGNSGLPDIIAAHEHRARVLFWELKSATGSIRTEQWRWFVALQDVPGIDARIVRPLDYDAALNVILNDVEPVAAFRTLASHRRRFG